MSEKKTRKIVKTVAVCHGENINPISYDMFSFQMYIGFTAKDKINSGLFGPLGSFLEV